MAKYIDGKTLAKKIKEDVAKKVAKYSPKPKLACIIVEGNKASEVYVASKEKACNECGMESVIIRLPEDVSEHELFSTIDRLNVDRSISGILLQLPLPSHLDDIKATGRIAPEKDVDCLTYVNLGALMSARGVIAPCTATGIIKILESENIDPCGKKVVVVGRSLLVGKSVANLLEQRNATVTICHSKTENLKEECRNADILVVAIGRNEMITAEYVKKGAVVIDVGINRTEEGLRGDVNTADVANIASYITPVPGGVGPLTVACLMENTLILHEELQKKQQLKGDK